MKVAVDIGLLIYLNTSGLGSCIACNVYGNTGPYGFGFPYKAKPSWASSGSLHMRHKADCPVGLVLNIDGSIP